MRTRSTRPFVSCCNHQGKTDGFGETSAVSSRSTRSVLPHVSCVPPAERVRHGDTPSRWTARMRSASDGWSGRSRPGGPVCMSAGRVILLGPPDGGGDLLGGHAVQVQVQVHRRPLPRGKPAARSLGPGLGEAKLVSRSPGRTGSYSITGSGYGWLPPRAGGPGKHTARCP